MSRRREKPSRCFAVTCRRNHGGLCLHRLHHSFPSHGVDEVPPTCTNESFSLVEDTSPCITRTYDPAVNPPGGTVSLDRICDRANGAQPPLPATFHVKLPLRASHAHRDAPVPKDRGVARCSPARLGHWRIMLREPARRTPSSVRRPSCQRLAGKPLPRLVNPETMSLSKNRLREGDRHILLRGLRKMSQSSTVFG